MLSSLNQQENAMLTQEQMDAQDFCISVCRLAKKSASEFRGWYVDLDAGAGNPAWWFYSEKKDGSADMVYPVNSWDMEEQEYPLITL